MSASISTRESGIGTEYLKRAAGLISGTAKNYVKDVMYTTTSTISEARSTITEVRTVLSSTQQHVSPILKMLKVQPSFKRISNWFLDKEEEYNDSDSGSDLSFDISTDNSEIAEEQISEIGRNANQISQAVVESSGKLAEAQMTATANLVSVAERQMSVIAAGFDKTNETLNKILEVLTKNTSALIESTVAGAVKSENDRMIANGKFSLSEYKNIIKTNASKDPSLSLITSFLPMLTNPDQIKDMLSSESIIGGLLNFGLNKGVNKFAPNFRKNAEALDKAVSDTIMTSLIRLGENRSDFGIKGTLAKIFGIDSSKKPADTSRPDLELKAVPFDSVTKEAITNAIPGYLRKILVAVGGEDVVYDYRSRSFRSKAAIHADFRKVAATTGTLGSASNNVRKSLGDGKVANLFYDLMMMDLGSKTSGGQYRDIIDSFKDVKAAERYIESQLGGYKLSKRDTREKKMLARRLSKASSGMGGIDIGNQVARTNVNRNYRVNQYVEDANAYEIDLSEINDGDHIDSQEIDKSYAMKKKNTKRMSNIKAEISSRKSLTGLNYTNVALYEIFRKLNEGINVYQVGGDKPFKRLGDRWLPKPIGHKPLAINEQSENRPTFYGGSSYYNNEETEDENDENISKGQKFAKWGKKRGGKLARAMFNGSPDDIRNAFSDIIGDITSAGKNLTKKGISKVNNKFGNVSGYVKHKIMGTGYSYTDVNGEEVRIKEGKGALGFITDEFKGMFEKAKSSSSKWIQTTLSYFDKPLSDDEDSGLVSKRKKLLGASIGALAGAGLLGGPLGLIMGGIAGNALASGKIGKKINKLLFGYDDEGENATGAATGIISKAADAVISPIKFQLGKTIAFSGAMVQKHIFGPMSDIGRSISDRIHNHVDSIFDKIKHTAGKIFGKIFGTIGKLVGKAAIGVATLGRRIGTTTIGKATRGVIGAGAGMIGGLQVFAANRISGKRSFHKLKKGESYPLLVGERYMFKDFDNNGMKTVRKVSKLTEDNPRVRWLDDYQAYGVLLDGDNPDEWQPATKDYNKKKRKERNTEIKENLKKSGFYNKGGILGFLGGDYKKWREQDRLKGMSRRAGLKNALKEQKMTPEEIAAANAAEQEKNRKQQEEIAKKQQETSEKISESVERTSNILEEERIPGSSFKVHDLTLEGLMNELIEVLSGGKRKKRKGGKGNKPVTSTSQPTEGTSIDGESESNDSDFANTAIGAIATIAAPGGMDNAETRTSIDAINEASKDKPNKKKISSLFSKIINWNKSSKEESEEKKSDSFISKLLGGLGSGLLKFWPLVLGGLTLLSSKFREGLFSLGSYLLDKLPDAFNFLKKTAETVNEYGEASTEGSEITTDPATGEKIRIVSAEQQNENFNDGYLNTAINQALKAPYSIFKNSLMSVGQNILANTTKHGISGGIKTTMFANSAKNLMTSALPIATAKMTGFKNAFSTSNSKTIFGKVWNGLKGFKGGASELQEAAILEGATNKTLFGNTKAKLDPLAGTRKIDFANKVMSTYDDLWKSTSGKIGSFAMGFAYDFGFSTGSRYQQMKSHKNYFGSYYDGTTTGGYRSIQGGAVESVVQFTTGAAMVAGCKLGAAAIIAATGAATIPIIGLATIVCLVAGTIIGYLTHWIIGNIQTANDEKFSVNTNATKMKHVLNEKIDYTQIDPAYIYNGKDSDRTLGLNAGAFIRNPEISFGYFVSKLTNEYNEAGARTCANHIGAEVLLYEFICNLAYQGVPWACYVAGSSKDVEASSNHANNDIWSDYSSNGEAGILMFKHDTIQVTKRKAKDNINAIMEDIQRSMKDRGFDDIIWDLDDLEYAYNSGKEVYDTLKSKGILNGKGEVVTKKFKGSYNSSKDSDGWKILCELGKSKGIYFVIKCIVFIDAHIDVKDNKHWAEINEDNINSLFYDINPDVSPSDIIPRTNNNKDDSSNGSNSSDHDGSTAEIDTGIVSANYSDLTEHVTNGTLSAEDVEGINQQIKYITAGWAFSHPNTVNTWLEKKGQEFYKQFKFTPLDIRDKKIVNWRDLGSQNKDAYLGMLRDASVAFAEEYGDIFRLGDKIDWSGFINGLGSSKVGIFGTGAKMKDKYGASVILKNDVSMGPSVGNYITDMYDEYFATSEPPTPDEVHDMLFGSPLHGGSLEKSSEDYDYMSIDSSLLGRIGKNIWYYPSSDVVNSVGKSSLYSDDYSTESNLPKYIKNMNLDKPEIPDDLAVGGPMFAQTYMNDGGGGGSSNTEIKEESGGNPLVNKPFKVTSSYGMRTLGGQTSMHKGIDIVPAEDTGTPTEIMSRFNGTISKVVNNIPDSHTGLGITNNPCGNQVWIDTDEGLRIKNFHLKAGSVPSTIREGQRISIGDKIGIMGSTGNSTGPHLHYQIETDKNNSDSHIDPIGNLSGGKEFYSGNGGSISSNSSGYSSYTDLSSNWNVSDGKDETNEDENPGILQSFIKLLGDIGSGFINMITGGIFGSSSSSSGSSGSSGSPTYDAVTYSNGPSSYTVSGTGAALAASMLDETIPIELLTNDQVNKLGFKAQKATVVDLLTGITYDIFWGGCPGSTHTDYSTYTADDTEKKVAACTEGGGTFPSWDPRPCILQIQGHQIPVGTHNRNHGSVIGGSPGPRCPDSSNTKVGKEWPAGGHFCMYYSDSVSNGYGLSTNAKQHQVACHEAYEIAKQLIEMKVSGGFDNTTIDGPANGTLGDGETLMFPDQYGVMETYEKEMIKNNETHGWSPSSRQGVLRKDAITRGKIKEANAYGLSRVATVDGRMLIATKENIGNKMPVRVGDHLDVKFKDGSVWNAMVGDIKGSDAAHPWGHQGGKCSTEIIYWDYNSNSGNQHKKIESITKTGGKYTLANGNAIGGDDLANLSSSNFNSSSYSISKKYIPKKRSPKSSGFTVGDFSSLSYSPSTSRYSSDSDIPTTGSSNISNDRIIQLLNAVIGELQQITGNTGDSVNLLGELNEKEFVDTELRNSINSISKSNNTNTKTRVPTSKNVNRVLNIASP